jgi:hypothetical protein
VSIAPKRLRPIALLAVVASLTLLIGLLARPKDVVDVEAPKPPPPTDVSRLRRLSLRGTLDALAGLFDLVAGDVEGHIVYLANHRSSGVVWDVGLVLAPQMAGQFPAWEAITMASGEMLPVRTAVTGPQLPLVGLTVPGAELPPAPRAEAPPKAAGAWLLVAWRHDQGLGISPANYLGTAEALCGAVRGREVRISLSLDESLAGASVFDLDGRLVAVVLRCDDRWTPVSMPTIEALLAYGGTVTGRLQGRFGLGLGALSEAEQLYFAAKDGVLVREVWNGYPADRAGLRPGDVILELDDQPVTSPEQLAALLLERSAPAPRLGLKRGLRALQVELSDQTEVVVADASKEIGLSWESAPPGHRVESVLEGSLADQAGILAGDRLLRIDRAPTGSLVQVRTLLRRRQPVFLELARGDRRYGVLLE